MTNRNDDNIQVDLGIPVIGFFIVLLGLVFILSFDLDKNALAVALGNSDIIIENISANIEDINNGISDAWDDDIWTSDDIDIENLPLEIRNLYVDLDKYILSNNLMHCIRVVYKENGIDLIISNDIWFEPGSYEINEQQILLTLDIGHIISKNQTEGREFKGIVSSHTDNLIINNSENNMNLSVERASKFLDVISENVGINPNNFIVNGMGENHPADNNDTSQGRKNNRRLELFIYIE